MKKVLMALALLASSSAFAGTLSPEQARAKLLDTPEVKAVYSVYKGEGWKCGNTQVELSSDKRSFTATKMCLNGDGEFESSVQIVIQGQIYGEGNDAITVVDAIAFNRAG